MLPTLASKRNADMSTSKFSLFSPTKHANSCTCQRAAGSKAETRQLQVSRLERPYIRYRRRIFLQILREAHAENRHRTMYVD